MRQKVEFILALLCLAGLIALSRNVSKHVSSMQIEARTESIADKNGTEDEDIGGKIEREKGKARSDSKDISVILDPGHGHTDPGKIGVNKAKEKDINLAVALLVKEYLEKEDIKVIMTRSEDISLAKKDAENSKIEDMKARVAMINEEAPLLTISIHQNSYQQESVAGAQVFYFTHSKEGKRAAELMQKALLAFDPDNKRLAKANDTYYLLKRTEVPTIIVECGFLTNWEEAGKLVTEEYQKEVAQAICQGAMEYLGKL